MTTMVTQTQTFGLSPKYLFVCRGNCPSASNSRQLTERLSVVVIRHCLDTVECMNKSFHVLPSQHIKAFMYSPHNTIYLSLSVIGFATFRLSARRSGVCFSEGRNAGKQIKWLKMLFFSHRSRVACTKAFTLRPLVAASTNLAPGSLRFPL
jgi:hypothetical protein